MVARFYVDKVLYGDYLNIIQKIILNEELYIQLFLLSNKCISYRNNINKLLVPYYYYKYCLKHMNILKIQNLTTHDRTFILVSYNSKIDKYYYLNIFCDTFNLLTPNQKNESYSVYTYKKLIKKLNKNKNSGGYLIKSVYDTLPDKMKKKLNIIRVQYGKNPLILTLNKNNSNFSK